MGLFRFSLAMLVFLEHMNYRDVINLNRATICVECFFIISGFYIRLLLDRKAVNIAHFYVSRALRIYPLYWLVLLSCFALSPPIIHTLLTSGRYDLAVIYILNNVSLLGQDILRLLQVDWLTGQFGLYLHNELASGFTPANGLEIVQQSWSLGIEMMFYLMAPFLLRLWLPAQGLIACLCFGSKAWMIQDGMYSTMWFNDFFPSEVGFFVAGSVAYSCYKKWLYGKDHFRGGVLFSFVACTAATSCVFASLLGIIYDEYQAYVTAILATIVAVPLLFSLSRTNKIDRWIGSLSYPVYLLHWPLIALVEAETVCTSHVLKALMIVALTLVMSVASVFFIEGPIDVYRHRRFPI